MVGRFLHRYVSNRRGKDVSSLLVLDCFQSEVQKRLQRRVRMGNQR